MTSLGVSFTPAIFKIHSKTFKTKKTHPETFVKIYNGLVVSEIFIDEQINLLFQNIK